jgi:hypothetical protein
MWGVWRAACNHPVLVASTNSFICRPQITLPTTMLPPHPPDPSDHIEVGVEYRFR